MKGIVEKGRKGLRREGGRKNGLPEDRLRGLEGRELNTSIHLSTSIPVPNHGVEEEGSYL